MKNFLGFLLMVFSIGSFAFYFYPDSVVALAPDNTELLKRDCWFKPEVGIAPQCYTLRVIESGKEFALPVVVLKAKQPNQHALLYLSGGPGGSTFLSPDDMIYWQAQYARFDFQSDLILVDRRGVGMALPLLQCPYYRREYRNGLAKNLSVQEESADNFRTLAWCLDQQLSEAPEVKRLAIDSLGTAADARDMQALISQLNYAQWSLWGVSYGTRLALAIAAQQPEGLQSLVLDSVYPPGRGRSDEWPLLMSSAMSRFFTWCDEHHCALGHELSSETQFQQALAQLDVRPHKLTVPSWYGDAPYNVAVNGQRYLQIVFGAIYDQYLWPTIGDSLRELASNKSEALEVLTESFVNNAFDPDFSELVFYAAECKDNAITDIASVDAALRAHPTYSAYLEDVTGSDICSAGVLNAVRGREELLVGELAAIQVPVLMLSGKVDPITPIDWVVPLQHLFPYWQQASFAEVGHAVVSSDVCAEFLLRDFVSRPAQKLNLLDESCAQKRVQLSSSERLSSPN